MIDTGIVADGLVGRVVAKGDRPRSPAVPTATAASCGQTSLP